MERLIRKSAYDLARYPAELVPAAPATCEPLLRERDGRLWQAIRLPADHRAVPRATLLGPDGDTVDHQRLDLRDGSVRLIVPAVERPVQLTARLHYAERDADVPVLVEPQRQWTVHLIHHSHLDVGYTDPQRLVLREHLGFLDACLEIARRTDDLPEDARFRWCVEALWIFERWAAQRDPDVVEEFLRRVSEGRFELTALPFTLHTETCTVDELHELTRGACELRRRHGVPMTVAMQTDVPGMTVGCVDALSEAGVRYLSVAHNWAGRSVPHRIGGERLPRLFRWTAPSGRSLLVWNTDTAHGWYMEGNYVGLHERYEDASELLPIYLSKLASEPYPYSVQAPKFLLPAVDGPVDRDPYPWDVLHLRVQGRLIDNSPPSDSLPELVRHWNAEWAYPRLRLSRNEDFFAEVERRYGDAVPTFEGDWSNWWADGIGSAAQPLAVAREAQRTAVEGQHLEAVARLLGAGAADLDMPVRAAYRAISLFNEHTWGAANPWSLGETGVDSGQAQWQWKAGRALEAAERADELAQRGAVRLGRALGCGEGALASVYAINPSGEDRTDLVSAFVPDELMAKGFVVRDPRAGHAIPHEERREGVLSRRQGWHVTFLAEDVPACGLRRFDLVEGAAGAGRPTRVSGVLENEYLRVELDLERACIGSLVDKHTGAELADREHGLGLNTYLYDRYGSAARTSYLSCVLTADDDLSLLLSRDIGANAALVERRSTPVAEELTYELHPRGADRIRVTARLAHGVPRLDLVNAVQKPYTEEKESAFFAFPFAVANPTVRFEVTGGVVGPDMPVVPGSAPHMRSIRRCASFEGNDGRAIAWATHDAPLLQHGGIALPYAPFPPTLPGPPRVATVFSWIHNNIWDTNFPPGQSIDMRFRYSIAVGSPPGPALAARTAAASGRPLVGIVTASVEADAHDERSLVALDDPRIRVVGLAPAANGGVLLRLQSLADEPVSLRIQFAADHAVSLASFTGDRFERVDVADGVVRIEVAPCSAAALLIDV